MLDGLRRNLQRLIAPAAGDLRAIDGLRAIAILWVMLFHILYSLGEVLTPEQLQGFMQQWPALLNFAWQGDKGVDIFFVVSGFLIGRMLLQQTADAQGAEKTLSRQAITEFYFARVLRIMPVYCLAIALWALRSPEKYLSHIPANSLFLEKLLPNAISVVPGGWSLGVEMHFYFLAPFLLLLMLALGRRALWLLLALILASSLLRYGLAVVYPERFLLPFWHLYFHDEVAARFDTLLYVLLPFRATPLLLGLAVAWLHHRVDWLGADKTEGAGAWPLRYLTAAGFTIALLAASLPYHDPQSFFYRYFSDAGNNFWLLTHRQVFSVGVALLLAGLLWQPQSWLRKVLSWTVWRPFSQLVLPLYLFHLAFMVLAAYCIYGEKSALAELTPWGVVGVFLLTLFFSSVFAVVVHLLLERPVMNARSLLLSKKR